MQIRPSTGARAPPIWTSAFGGVPWHPVAVPDRHERHPHRLGRPRRCGRRRRRRRVAGPWPAPWSREPSSPAPGRGRRGDDVGGRAEAVERDAEPDQVVPRRRAGAGHRPSWPDGGPPAPGPRRWPAHSASSKASCWRAFAGWSGSSAQARCDQRPVTTAVPRPGRLGPRSPARASRRAGRRCGRGRCRTSAAVAPPGRPRAHPVRRRPPGRCWRRSRRRRRPRAARSPRPGRTASTRSRPVSPAARSASASSRVATPSHSAPASREACATGTMPCP